jgi:hypothetical protein
MVAPFAPARSASDIARTSLRSAALALTLLLAHPAAAAQAQTPDAPAPKAAAPKRAKSAAHGDTQQAAPTAVKRDPAAAQAAVDASAKLLEAGKTDQAVASLSSAISGGNLPPQVMAKALYLRGSAYRKQAKPGLAISDLTSALWLKGGLSEADRADATQQRVAAYSEAGLGDQGASNAAGATRKRADGASASLAPESTTTSSSSGFFGKLFGGSTSAAAPAPAAAPAAETQPKPARPQRAPSAPETQAAAQAANPPPASSPPQPTRVATATVAAKPQPATAGTFQSRVALVKTRAEADAVVAKLKAQHAAALADKAPSIGEAAFGSMGTFFQVRIGPFGTSAEATALCGRLKGSGLDCVAVNN